MAKLDAEIAAAEAQKKKTRNLWEEAMEREVKAREARCAAETDPKSRDYHERRLLVCRQHAAAMTEACATAMSDEADALRRYAGELRRELRAPSPRGRRRSRSPSPSRSRSRDRDRRHGRERRSRD